MASGQGRTPAATDLGDKLKLKGHETDTMTTKNKDKGHNGQQEGRQNEREGRQDTMTNKNGDKKGDKRKQKGDKMDQE